MQQLLNQRVMSNKEIKGYRSVKSIVKGVQGRLFIDCVVRSVVNNKFYTTREIGEASGNMSNFGELKYRAFENAIYKHISEGGKSGARVIKINNYWIKYFNDDVSVKRERVQEFQIISVPPHTRIQKVTKKIKVKGYTKKDGTKVKGYTRTKDVFKEILVKGYEKKRPIGKGKYKSVTRFKDRVVDVQDFKFRSVDSLNQDLKQFNEVKGVSEMIRRI